MCPAFTHPLDTAAKTAPRSQRDEDINAQHGTRAGQGVSGRTERGGGGNVLLHGCGNDRVTVVNRRAEMHLPVCGQEQRGQKNMKRGKEEQESRLLQKTLSNECCKPREIYDKRIV